MFKFIFFVLFALGLFFNSYAQINKNKWYLGKVWLKNGQFIEGKLKYNDEKEILQVKDGNKLKAFNASQVVQFNFFDRKEEKDRSFVSREYDLYDRGYPVPLFFERLAEGSSLTLLCRHETPAKMRGFADNSIQSYFAGEIEAMDIYYFQNQKNEIIRCGTYGSIFIKKEIKRVIAEIVGDKKDEMEEFFSKKPINVKRQQDLIEFTRYYNSL